MCQADHTKSSGAMEAVGAIDIFSLSVEKHKLIFIKTIVVMEIHFLAKLLAQSVISHIREQSLSLTGTGVEGNQQGYEIFCMTFAGV